jgi:hypothetical protein
MSPIFKLLLLCFDALFGFLLVFGPEMDVGERKKKRHGHRRTLCPDKNFSRRPRNSNQEERLVVCKWWLFSLIGTTNWILIHPDG